MTIAVRDDVGRAVILAQAARRIVSLVPSLTETLFALGCADALVGVTRYCTEPAGAVDQIERVGGTKNPDVRRIAELRPDLVLLNAEENRKQDFETLAQAGLTLFVSYSHRARDVPDLLRRLGELTARLEEAAHLAIEIRNALAAMEPARYRPRVFCPIWKNPWMSFNLDTYADDMLWCAGGENVCRNRAPRYVEVTLEEMAAEMPEVILLPDEPYVFSEKDLSALAALHSTPAYQRGRVHFIDGKALSWYGPRTAPALHYLGERLAAGAPAQATKLP